MTGSGAPNGGEEGEAYPWLQVHQHGARDVVVIVGLQRRGQRQGSQGALLRARGMRRSEWDLVEEDVLAIGAIHRKVFQNAICTRTTCTLAPF